MRSLQMKFSALVVALLLGACVGLAWIATQHERSALESEVEKRGEALAENLARNAREPLLAGEELDQLTLDRLVQAVGRGEGVVGARVLDREGRVVASLDGSERGVPGTRLVRAAGAASELHSARVGS